MEIRKVGAGGPKELNLNQNVRQLPKEAKNKAVSEDQVYISGGDEGVKKDWLVIYYGASDNGLSLISHENINRMEKIGSNERVHVVAYLDVGKEWVPTPIKNAKIFYVERDKNPRKITSPIVADLGKVNSANTKNIANIVSAIVKKYPAKHIALILAGYGAGWRGALDDSSSRVDYLSPKSLGKALSMINRKIGRKIDVLVWEAGAMASAEVMHALKPYAKYMVASEGDISHIMPYDRFLAKLEGKLEDGEVTPKELSKLLVDSARKFYNSITGNPHIPQMSAIDLSKAEKFFKKFREFNDALLSLTDRSRKDKPESELQMEYQVIADLFREAQTIRTSSGTYKDVFDFIDKVAKSKDVKDKKIKSLAKELSEIRRELIVSNYRSRKRLPNAKGLQVAGDSYEINHAYLRKEFNAETHWGYTLSQYD